MNEEEKDKLRVMVLELIPIELRSPRPYILETEWLEMCRQVAKTLTLIQKDKYAHALVDITRELKDGEARPAYLSWFVVVNASWEQHAQAIRFAKNLPD